eukprot:8234835-Lingulodinium_polyedra.AAC.1
MSHAAVLQTLDVPLSVGGVFKWQTVNLQCLFQHLCEHCAGLRSAVVEARKRRLGDYIHPWHIVLYMDV